MESFKPAFTIIQKVAQNLDAMQKVQIQNFFMNLSLLHVKFKVLIKAIAMKRKEKIIDEKENPHFIKKIRFMDEDGKYRSRWDDLIDVFYQ